MNNTLPKENWDRAMRALNPSLFTCLKRAVGYYVAPIYSACEQLKWRLRGMYREYRLRIYCRMHGFTVVRFNGWSERSEGHAIDAFRLGYSWGYLFRMKDGRILCIAPHLGIMGEKQEVRQ